MSIAMKMFCYKICFLGNVTLSVCHMLELGSLTPFEIWFAPVFTCFSSNVRQAETPACLWKIGVHPYSCLYGKPGQRDVSDSGAHPKYEEVS